MFYSHELLCRKRSGRFSVVWLAASHDNTLQRIFNRRTIQSANVERIVNDIQDIVMDRYPVHLPHSKNAPKRFSLYLSSKLMYGCCCVLRRQAIYLRSDASSLSIKIMGVWAEDLQQPRSRKTRDLSDDWIFREIGDLLRDEGELEFRNSVPPSTITLNEPDRAYQPQEDNDLGPPFTDLPPLHGAEAAEPDSVLPGVSTSEIGQPDLAIPEILAPVPGEHDSIQTDVPAPVPGERDSIRTDSSTSVLEGRDSLPADVSAVVPGERDSIQADISTAVPGERDSLPADVLVPVPGEHDSIPADVPAAETAPPGSAPDEIPAAGTAEPGSPLDEIAAPVPGEHDTIPADVPAAETAPPGSAPDEIPAAGTAEPGSPLDEIAAPVPGEHDTIPGVTVQPEPAPPQVPRQATRRGRRRKLIIDKVTQISGTEFRQQINDASGTLRAKGAINLAFPVDANILFHQPGHWCKPQMTRVLRNMFTAKFITKVAPNWDFEIPVQHLREHEESVTHYEHIEQPTVAAREVVEQHEHIEQPTVAAREVVDQHELSPQPVAARIDEEMAPFGDSGVVARDPGNGNVQDSPRRKRPSGTSLNGSPVPKKSRSDSPNLTDPVPTILQGEDREPHVERAAVLPDPQADGVFDMETEDPLLNGRCPAEPPTQNEQPLAAQVPDDSHVEHPVEMQENGLLTGQAEAPVSVHSPVASLSPDCDEAELMLVIQRLWDMSDPPFVDFEEVCPVDVTTKDRAACVFGILLELHKRKALRLDQENWDAPLRIYPRY